MSRIAIARHLPEDNTSGAVWKRQLDAQPTRAQGVVARRSGAPVRSVLQLH